MITAILEKHIETTPGIAGGKPHIAGHRITVQNIAIWHEYMGESVDEICAEYNLSLGEVYSALSYYFEHRAEIEQNIADDEAFVADLRQKTPSVLQAKLRTMPSE